MLTIITSLKKKARDEGFAVAALLPVFVAALLARRARATSAGSEGSCADAVSLCTLDCPDDGASRPWGDKCCPKGMDLVAPPVESNKYAVTFSKQEYTPCDIITVNVDVLDKDFKYLGLLLYAVPVGSTQGEAEKVGTFVIPPKHSGDGNNAVPKFWTPPSCKGHALMHANAGIKHYHHEFSWQAPAAGTGAVEFRALVKHGETNGGSFFWPTFPNGKVLQEQEQEGSAPKDIWIKAPRGSSCAQMCASVGGACDEPAMRDALTSTSKAVLSGDLREHFVCQQPFLSISSDASEAKCASAIKPLSTDDLGFCYCTSLLRAHMKVKSYVKQKSRRAAFCCCQGATLSAGRQE